MSSYPDIPVVCTDSGMMLLLEKVVDGTTIDFCVQKVYKEGAKAEIEGFPCPACQIGFHVQQCVNVIIPKTIVLPTGKPSCKYRPLRGPLFVPR